MKFYRVASTIFILCIVSSFSWAQHTGHLQIDDQPEFPIGFYELPEEDSALQEMADAWVNLIRCRNKNDLDRVHAKGMLGVMPLPFQNGPTDDLKEKIQSVVEHPALAIWEGPDEIVWNFTAYSRLYRTENIHKVPRAWWKQTENAVNYAEEQANKIIPNMRETVEYIRSVDTHDRPVWINEALQSDLLYVRQYLDFVDITGCDIYPVKKDDRRIHRMASATERWNQVGEGRPVFMVMQAFTWNELGDYYGETDTAYPTFKESRFMAYDVIAHGADGILYWGSHYLKSHAFRQSLYALISELSTLQPFLVQPNVDTIDINLIEIPEEETRGVQAFARFYEDQLMIVLVNEDNRWHMGVEVNGLESLNGTTMHQLYSDDTTQIQNGNLLTRIVPYEVQVFASSRKWESGRRDGREFE